MKIVHAYYLVKFIYNKPSTGSFIIEPILKVGNQELLNRFFENKAIVKGSRVGPIEEMDGYIHYKMWYLSETLVKHSLLLRSQTYVHPFGSVNTTSSDCILFKDLGDGVMEIIISKDNVSQSAYILTLYSDGALNNEIENFILPFKK